MTPPSPAKMSPYRVIDEPLLAFSPDQQSVHPHPLVGLASFGPYTGRSLPTFTPQVRIAIVGPNLGREGRRLLLTSLRNQLEPNDRRDYVPTYPGFEKLFGVKLVPASESAQISIPGSLAEIQHSSDSPFERVRSALSSAMDRLEVVRDLFDVAVFHLPDTWSAGLRGGSFDAHDELKALGAAKGIPTQVVNDRTFTFKYHASRAWRLGIATYVKAGGVPWKLAPIPTVPDNTAYIGLAYALRGDPASAQFVTCCSQVFDSDGGGMQFVAYDARDPITDLATARSNPYLSSDDMRAVLARSIRLYQSRNGGNMPRRVVLHKTTAFRDDELSGAHDALAAIDDVDCVEITTSVSWRGVWLTAPRTKGTKGVPDGYPVHRGAVLPLSSRSALVWVAGNAPAVAQRGNFYQGGKSIPTPVMVTHHSGRGSIETIATEIVGLSKMDWNNDALYGPSPVTIRYSQQLARTIANVPSLRREAYPYRLFM